MLFVVLLAAILTTAGIHIAVSRQRHRTIEIFLIYLLVGYYGVCMLYAAFVHLLFPQALASYKGWPASAPIQTLYAFALIGLSVAALLCIRFRGVYLLGPAVAGSLLLFGGAYVHIREILRAGRFMLLKDGPEIVLDLLVPLIVLSLTFTHLRKSGAVARDA